AARNALPYFAPTKFWFSRAWRGLSNEAISSLHGLDIEAARFTSRAILAKLHARNRAELMKAATAIGHLPRQVPQNRDWDRNLCDVRVWGYTLETGPWRVG